MKKKFAVIGLGDFGWSIAITLAERGADVVAVDKDMEIIEEIKDKVAYAARLDSTDEKALKSLGLENIDAVVVSIGTNFEDTILTSVLLQQMKVKKVMARVSSKIQETILTKLGIHQVINPELEIAGKVASNLLNEDVLNYIPLDEDYNIVHVRAPEYFRGKSLQEIDLRLKYNVNLVTIKRRYKVYNEEEKKDVYKERIYGVPTAGTVIEDGDVLILLGRDKDIKKILE